MYPTLVGLLREEVSHCPLVVPRLQRDWIVLLQCIGIKRQMEHDLELEIKFDGGSCDDELAQTQKCAL